MTRSLDVQYLASGVLIGAMTASELSAWHLALHPGSEMAWYLEMELFRPFATARTLSDSGARLFQWLTPANACIMFGLSTLARLLAWRFGVALVANLCFLATVTLASSWMAEVARGEAVLTLLRGGHAAGTAMVTVLLCAGFVACWSSHAGFLRDVSAEARQWRVSPAARRAPA